MSEHCVQVFLRLSSEHGSEKETERIAELTDKLFDAIKKPLLASTLSKGGHAIKRYGEASDKKAKEVRIDL